MNECVFCSYKKIKSFKITKKIHKIKTPLVTVTEMIVPENFYCKYKMKRIIKKYVKNGIIVLSEVDTKPLLERNIIYILKYLSNIYGYNLYEMEIGIILKEYNDTIYDMIEKVSKLCRCINIYEFNNINSILNDVSLKSGTCITKGNNMEEEKILIDLRENLSINIKNKAYFDIKLIYNTEKISLDSNIYDRIFRVYSSNGDLKTAIKEKIVKKMVLMSK